MSFRLEMLQVARLAPKLLGESADLVREFLLGKINGDGGFQDRAGRSDLYYTVFGIEGLLALQAEVPWERIVPYLSQFGAGDGLDFIHRCCLARCIAASKMACPATQRQAILTGVETFRTPDGGYNQRLGATRASTYGSLLGFAAHADLRSVPADADRLAACLRELRSTDGGYANEPGLPLGTTPAVAAAISLHRHLRRTPDAVLGDWLLAQAHPQGGFKAMASAPLPDLLSTAVALHALDAMQVPYGHLREACLDFVDSLWTNEGAFHGNWTDHETDVEYTYYGLLALGHLSFGTPDTTS